MYKAFSSGHKLNYGILQGDRTKNVGVVDSEFIVHKGIQSLGGGDMSERMVSCSLNIVQHIHPCS